MRVLHLLSTLLLLPAFAFTNSLNSTTIFSEEDRQVFINRFIDIAVEEMGRTGIPASITLAQAIVESGWGQGSIATEANNFFCIKCWNGWTGPTFQEWDDEEDKSCFRKYESVIQSFIDHSDFLADNIRYRPLFELDRLDYISWAKGLKECGYATNEEYAQMLIEVIENYGLWIYDYAVPASQMNILDTEEIETAAELSEPINEGMETESTNQPNYWAPAPAAPQRTSAPAVMEVPDYRRESIPATAATPPSFGDSQYKYKIPRTRKIRPIMPLPNIDMERR